MKVIQPTPSQAAVVLKNFFRRNSINISLGLAQEAIAATKGYDSWNSLASNENPRGGKVAKGTEKQGVTQAPAEASDATCCHSCGSPLFGKYCSDSTCPYSDWPQAVPKDALHKWSTAEIERHFGPKRHDVSIAEIEQMSRDAGKELEALAHGSSERYQLCDLLKDKLEGLVDATGLYSGLRRWTGRDECAEEDWNGPSRPYIQLSYDIRHNAKFCTELVVTLRDHELNVYVRTWESLDGLEPSSKHQIFDEASGDFDTNASRPDEEEPLQSLLQSALDEAKAHHKRLAQNVNV